MTIIFTDFETVLKLNHIIKVTDAMCTTSAGNKNYLRGVCNLYPQISLCKVRGKYYCEASTSTLARH